MVMNILKTIIIMIVILIVITKNRFNHKNRYL